MGIRYLLCGVVLCGVEDSHSCPLCDVVYFSVDHPIHCPPNSLAAQLCFADASHMFRIEDNLAMCRKAPKSLRAAVRTGGFHLCCSEIIQACLVETKPDHSQKNSTFKLYCNVPLGVEVDLISRGHRKSKRGNTGVPIKSIYGRPTTAFVL